MLKGVLDPQIPMSRFDFMRRTRWVLLALGVSALGCGPAPVQLAPYEHEVAFSTDAGSPTESPDAAPADADPCATRSTGCSCDVEGATAECGIVREKIGDYVRCTPAYRACVDGAWGPCVGDRVVGPR